MSTATQPRMMPERERGLLKAAIGDQPVRLALRTESRIDTGRWLGRSRLWLCITEAELVLLTGSKREHVERAALADCNKSTYCHSSGRLLIAPAEHLRFRSIDLTPTDALLVLRLLKAEAPSGDPNPSQAMENQRA